VTDRPGSLITGKNPSFNCNTQQDIIPKGKTGRVHIHTPRFRKNHPLGYHLNNMSPRAGSNTQRVCVVWAREKKPQSGLRKKRERRRNLPKTCCGTKKKNGRCWQDQMEGKEQIGVSYVKNGTTRLSKREKRTSLALLVRGDAPGKGRSHTAWGKLYKRYPFWKPRHLIR